MRTLTQVRVLSLDGFGDSAWATVKKARAANRTSDRRCGQIVLTCFPWEHRRGQRGNSVGSAWNAMEIGGE